MPYYLFLIILSIGLVSPTFAETTSSASQEESAETPQNSPGAAPECVLENDMYYLKRGGKKCNIIPYGYAVRINIIRPGFCPELDNRKATEKQYEAFSSEAKKSIPKNKLIDVIYQSYTDGLSDGNMTLDDLSGEGCFVDHPTLKYMGLYSINALCTKGRVGPFLGAQGPLAHFSEVIQLIADDLSQALADAYFNGKLYRSELTNTNRAKKILEQLYEDKIVPRYTLNHERFKDEPINMVFSAMEGNPINFLNAYRSNGQYKFSDYESTANGYTIRSLCQKSDYSNIRSELETYLDTYVY